MILEQEKAEHLHKPDVKSVEKEFRVNNINPSILIKIVADLYKNPRRTVLTEYVQNAIDSHVMATHQGLKIPKPVEVSLPNKLHPYYVVRDYGVSMSQDEVENIFGVVFESNKRDSDDLIGGFGVGKLVFSPYCGVMFLTTFSGSHRTEYLIRLKDGVGGYTEVASTPSTEPRGVEIKLPVKEEDFEYFADLAEVLYSFITPSVVVKNFTKGSTMLNWRDYVTFSSPNHQWYLLNEDALKTDYPIAKSVLSPTTNTKCFVTLNGLPFPLDIDSLDSNMAERFKSLTDLKMYLPFKTGELDLVPSRDSLKYNQKTRDAIVQRLRSVEGELRDIVDGMIGNMHTEYELRSFSRLVKYMKAYEYPSQSHTYYNHLTVQSPGQPCIHLGGKTISSPLLPFLSPDKIQRSSQTPYFTEAELSNQLPDDRYVWVNIAHSMVGARYTPTGTLRNHKLFTRESSAIVPAIGDDLIVVFGRNCKILESDERMETLVAEFTNGARTLYDRRVKPLIPTNSKYNKFQGSSTIINRLGKAHTCLVCYIDIKDENKNGVINENYEFRAHAEKLRSYMGIPKEQCFYIDELTINTKAVVRGSTRPTGAYSVQNVFKYRGTLMGGYRFNSTDFTSCKLDLLNDEGVYIELNNFKVQPFKVGPGMNKTHHSLANDLSVLGEGTIVNFGDEPSPVALNFIIQDVAALTGLSLDKLYFFKSETVRKVVSKGLTKRWKSLGEHILEHVMSQKMFLSTSIKGCGLTHEDFLHYAEAYYTYTFSELSSFYPVFKSHQCREYLKARFPKKPSTSGIEFLEKANDDFPEYFKWCTPDIITDYQLERPNKDKKDQATSVYSFLPELSGLKLYTGLQDGSKRVAGFNAALCRPRNQTNREVYSSAPIINILLNFDTRALLDQRSSLTPFTKFVLLYKFLTFQKTSQQELSHRFCADDHFQFSTKELLDSAVNFHNKLFQKLGIVDSGFTQRVVKRVNSFQHFRRIRNWGILEFALNRYKPTLSHGSNFTDSLQKDDAYKYMSELLTDQKLIDTLLR